MHQWPVGKTSSFLDHGLRRKVRWLWSPERTLFAKKPVQLGREYLFYMSLTMEATIDTPQFKYNLDTCEMQSLCVGFKME